MTSSDLLAEFFRHLSVERGLSENTLLSYGYQLKGYLAFLAARGKGTLSSERNDVLAYMETKKNNGLRSATLFITAIAIRQFHRFLKERGHASVDPTESMRLPKFKQRLPEPLDQERMRRLLHAPPASGFAGLRNRAMLELMYATGMRVSELIGLRLEQLDMRSRWVRVMGKGSKERLVPFGNQALGALRRYLKIRSASFPSVTDAIFLNKKGHGPMTRSGFGWNLKVTSDRAGLPCRLTPHQIRHSCATHLLEGGMNVRILQELLGHRSVSTTQRYTHVTAKLLMTACQKAHPQY